MRRTLLGLWLRSARNRILNALRGLRSPRRLVGLVFGLLYFYWLLTGFGRRGRVGRIPDVSDAAEFLPLAATAMMLAGLVVTWALPSYRLFRANRAEATWLLQAPISRRVLAESYLLRDQIGLVFSALISGYFLRWVVPGGYFRGCLAMWGFLALLNFHGALAAIVRFRLRRRFGRVVAGVLPASVVLAALLLPFLFLPRETVAPALERFLNSEGTGLAGLPGFVRSVEPLCWFVRIGDFFARPLFPGQSLLAGFAPVLAVVLLHLPLVGALSVPVVQESILAHADAADRREKVLQGRIARKRRIPPWKLRPRGPRLVAFLWKGLAAQGTWGRASALWLPAGALVAALVWRLTGPAEWQHLVGVSLGPGSLALAAILFFMSDRFGMRRGLYRDLGCWEVLKTFPCGGGTIVLGEVLAPVLSFTIGILTALVFGMILLTELPQGGIPALWSVPLVGCALLVLPVNILATNLMMNALLLLWPGTFSQMYSGDRGIEATGSRLVLVLLHMASFLALMLPAAIVGAIAGVPAVMLLGPPGILMGAAGAAMVLAGECAALLYFCHLRFEALDLGADLPPG